MINKIRHKIFLSLIIFLSLGIQVFSQVSNVKITGIVTESGSNKPLQQVTISVNSTGDVADTDKDGKFTIMVPNEQSGLSFYLPGFHRLEMYLNGNDPLAISLVALQFNSMDESYNKPLGSFVKKNSIYAETAVRNEDISLNNITSFEQALQGIIPGLQVINQSGMPGEKSMVNIRGAGSFYGQSEPLLVIDGIIHDYNYANYGNMEGFTINPFEIVDIEDVADISVLRGGDSYMGVAGSNGIINVNTEQKSTASTLIKISGSTGISMRPKTQSLMDGPQFNQYVLNVLSDNGVTTDMAKESYPQLFGEGNEKYRYGNDTDWQKEIYELGVLQKYHIFLKGGDDIGTYNISTGLINQDGPLINSGYNRFNLRINGLVNITNKFSVTPNFKLSLTDTDIPNLGPTYQRNPVLSSILKAPIMAPYYIDPETGTTLEYLDNEGIFGFSNPVKIVKDATGNSRNYHFGASVKLGYIFNENFKINNILGLNFNNARENIFIPDNGIAAVAWYENNSPRDFVLDYRSLQNHFTLDYSKELEEGKNLDIQTGFKYMKNTYRHNQAIDLNTASDDFKNLGDGGSFQYLRQNIGSSRDLLWMAYFVNGTYNIKNRYILNANLSIDANSANNTNNRVNVFPSLGAAWRISSEEFLVGNSNIDDLKLRASFSQSGNMYSSIYDYSKLYYNEQRVNEIGVPVREAIPNPNLAMEKTSSINLGMDLTTGHQTLNLHVDAYYSLLNNMIIQQQLSPSFGYTEYYDNGGKLSNLGVEIAADYRKNFGELIWTVGGNLSTNISTVSALNFINTNNTQLITTLGGAQYVTQKGQAINSFYGYKTEGIYSDNSAANAVIGPRGVQMQAGDIKFANGGDNVVDESDKTTIGNPNPDLFGGFFTGFNFNEWQIKANFNYSVGNDIYNYSRYLGESMSSYANQMETVLNRWTPENTNSSMPRASIGDPTGNTVFSDRWIEDGSYLKLKHLTVSYNLPGSKFYSGIKLYVTASNLFTLTNYSGNDPEFFYLNNPFYMGIDYGKTPHARSFIVGVKLDL